MFTFIDIHFFISIAFLKYFGTVKINTSVEKKKKIHFRQNCAAFQQARSDFNLNLVFQLVSEAKKSSFNQL